MFQKTILCVYLLGAFDVFRQVPGPIPTEPANAHRPAPCRPVTSLVLQCLPAGAARQTDLIDRAYRPLIRYQDR